MKRALQAVKLTSIFRSFSIKSVTLQRGNMSKKTFFYAVQRGRMPGVYKTWSECSKEVNGFPQAVYRKFPTYEAAEEFVKLTKLPSGGDSRPSSSVDEVDRLPPKSYDVSIMPPELQPVQVGKISRKKVFKGKKNCDNQVRALLSQIEDLKKEVSELRAKHKVDSDVPDVNEPPSKQIKLTDFEIPKTMVHVYTDGACTKNGFNGAKAGIGVYWGPDHPLNVSERLPGRQTNNRAEIQAAVKALQQAKSVNIKEITVYTDSNFLINGVTKWVRNWKRNGWKLSNGQPVINKTDFEDLLRAKDGLLVKWVHVPGHSGFAGNEAADQLAVQGIEKPLPQE